MPRETQVQTAVVLGPLELPNPIVTASGTYGHGDEVARHGDPSRLGAITAKSLCADPWPGNPAPRLHLAAAGMLNAVGLQGPGVSAWVESDLPRLRAAGARVIASVWGQQRRRVRPRREAVASSTRRPRRRRGECQLSEPAPTIGDVRPRSRVHRSGGGCGCRRRSLASRLREVVAQRDRCRRDRARSRRSRRRRIDAREHGHGNRDRRRDAPPGARERGRRAVRAGDQTRGVARCTR